MAHNPILDTVFTSHELSGKSRQYEDIFPEPPVGKRLLDIGCSVGYYLMRAALEGAESILGIDIAEASISKANTVVGVLGCKNARFLVNTTSSLYCFHGEVDITLCLNVLHHLSDIHVIKRVLCNIDKLTTERMVFITSKPKDGKPWSRKGQLRGRMALAPEYFMGLFPHYHIIARDNVPSGKRYLIDIRKKYDATNTSI